MTVLLVDTEQKTTVPLWVPSTHPLPHGFSQLVLLPSNKATPPQDQMLKPRQSAPTRFTSAHAQQGKQPQIGLADTLLAPTNNQLFKQTLLDSTLEVDFPSTFQCCLSNRRQYKDTSRAVSHSPMPISTIQTTEVSQMFLELEIKSVFLTLERKFQLLSPLTLPSPCNFVGGTSASTPLWGSLITLLNQDRLAAKKVTKTFSSRS
jgi:hypothetical protein